VSPSWFNLSAPPFRVAGRRIRLWIIFNRVPRASTHWWGIGLLQIGNRHLLYVGDQGVRVLFIGRTA